MKSAKIFQQVEEAKVLVREYTEESLAGSPIEDPKAAAEAFLTGRVGYTVETEGYGLEDGYDSYESLNVKQLVAECEARKIEVPEKAKKPALIALLEQWDVENPEK